MRKSKSGGRKRTSYRVGKGRPPLATRWKPGQSGNPKGRRKGRNDLIRIIRAELDRKIQISESGQPRSISVLEGIVKVVSQKALKGDLKAAIQLLGYDGEISENPQSIPEQTPDQISHDPNAAAEAYFRIVKGERS